MFALDSLNDDTFIGLLRCRLLHHLPYRILKDIKENDNCLSCYSNKNNTNLASLIEEINVLS
jgi:hypothetical protein